MGKRGKGYGSEDHFLRYSEQRPAILDTAILEKIRAPAGASIDWFYPPRPTNKAAREPQGLTFLKDQKGVLAKWHEFWPQTGRQQTWDGVARLQVNGKQSDWLLIEAKATHPEFCSGPSQASKKGGYKQIERSLGRTKGHLGVHRDFPWLGTYYQYANRLACLYFLNSKADVPARLVAIYFTGDSFPNGRRCPASEGEWNDLIHARGLTLGLPDHHQLKDRIHEVFLSATPQATV